MNPLAMSHPPGSSTEIERAFAEALSRAGRDELTSVEVPAPLCPAEALLPRGAEDAWVFAPKGGFECAATGAVRVISAAGPERFEAIRAQAERVYASLTPHPAGEPVRWFGGFSFQSGRAKSPLWSAFGEARFVLPRLTYVRDGGRATLSLLLSRQELDSAAERRAALRELEEARARLGAYPPSDSVTPSKGSSTRPLSFDGGVGRPEWQRLVSAIVGAIDRGQFEKVVLARRVDVKLPEPLDPAQVLARLRISAPECTRFLCCLPGRAFLGAAPERLVKKRGQALETEAVAGSIDTSLGGSIARLLESTKDLAEHQVVVRGILDALAGVVSPPVHPPRPELHELRHVAHLRTPIHAQLLDDVHVLALVQRLHPTPAVGGLPRAAALSWIAENEADERGWYAGPVGYFDAAGDGEFAVALRSGVLAGAEAHLYVGAGIVRDSAPDDEFAETEWKLAALAGALGVGP